MSESTHSIQRLRPVGRIECGELIFEVLPQHIRVRVRGLMEQAPLPSAWMQEKELRELRSASSPGATALPALLNIAQAENLRGFLNRVLGTAVRQPEFERVLLGLENTLAILRQSVTGVPEHAPFGVSVDVAEIQAVIAEMHARVHDPVLPESVRGTVEQWQTRLALALRAEAAGLDAPPASPSQES